MKAPQSADPSFQLLQPLTTLSPVRRHLLFRQAELKPLHKGDTLFHIDDIDHAVYYLVEGKIELRDADGERIIVEASSNLPLAPLQPRQATAKALTTVTVLQCERGWLDALLLPALVEPLFNNVNELPDDEQPDWLQRLLGSELFRRLPAANLQQIFSQCEALAFAQGQTVIAQGSQDGGFYIIQSGHCEVSYTDEQGRVVDTIAYLGPGDWFGEVSLIANVPHSMTVTMQSEGALLRLGHQSFDNLIRLPLVEALDDTMAKQRLQSGARWLDVREAKEVAADPHSGAAQLAFSQLMTAGNCLDKNKHYIVLCDSGARSAVATFILAVQGYTASWLRGGLATARGHQSAIGDSESVTVDNTADPLLQELRNELTGLLRQVDHAMHLKRDAEKARREAERAAVAQMNAERERLREQASQVRGMLEQTQELQRRLVEEKQRLYAGVREREEAMDRRVTNLNTYIEQRVAEERARIAEQYQMQEAEIERLQNEKQAAEARLKALNEADGDKQEARTALEAEFEQFDKDLKASEEERHQAQAAATQEIVSELADDREEFSDYEKNKQRLSQEREQLQSQAQHLSSAVQETLIDKQASLAVRNALQDELKKLDGTDASVEPEQRNQTDDALRAATARYNEAEQAYENAVNAQEENAAALAETQQAESQLLAEMNAEVESWMQEQAQQPRSAKQEALVQRYEETMQRMKQEAANAEEQERTRDDLLLSDINAELATIAESRSKQASRG